MERNEMDSPGQQPYPPVNWQDLKGLLETGQYSQAEAILHRLLGNSRLSNDSLLACYLMAAWNLCLMCQQCRADLLWHQKVCDDIRQREYDLRTQLEQLFESINQHAPELKAPRLKSPMDVLTGLKWQRILQCISKVFKKKKQPQPSELPQLDSQEELQPGPGLFPLLLVNGDTVPASPGCDAPSIQMLPALSIHCLGSFQVYEGDQLINNWPSGKGKAILKYMVASSGRPVFRDVLIDTFWRGADPDAARKNLYVAIHGLRQAFKAVQPDFPHILFYDDHYFLNPDLEVWIDIEEFNEHFQAGQSLERRGSMAEAILEYEAAESLYTGDFLEEDLYDEWIFPLRQSLKENYIVLLDHLSRYYLVEENYHACIQFCQKLLARDNCHEDTHRRLICTYSRQGKRSLAIRQYQLCVETLQRELGVAPVQETVTLFKRLCAGEAV